MTTAAKYQVRFRLTSEQIDSILDKVVPIVALPGEEEVIRIMIREVAESSTASDFSVFLSNLLRSQQKI